MKISHNDVIVTDDDIIVNSKLIREGGSYTSSPGPEQTVIIFHNDVSISDDDIIVNSKLIREGWSYTSFPGPEQIIISHDSQ